MNWWIYNNNNNNNNKDNNNNNNERTRWNKWTQTTTRLEYRINKIGTYLSKLCKQKKPEKKSYRTIGHGIFFCRIIWDRIRFRTFEDENKHRNRIRTQRLHIPHVQIRLSRKKYFYFAFPLRTVLLYIPAMMY